MSATDPSSDSTGQEPAPNSIRGGRRKNAAGAAVPEEIAKRFVQVANKYYFPDGARAFTDRGNRLTTQSENTEVVRSLVGIAKARAWQEITVRGTERFRQEVWRAASVAGLEVRGYKPDQFEQSRRAQTFARSNPRYLRRDRMRIPFREARLRSKTVARAPVAPIQSAACCYRVSSSITAAPRTNTIRVPACPIS